jgi:hypothetical protein
MMDIGSSGHQIRVLAGVAAHLASALDVLTLGGCDWFAADLAEMLAVIDGHIAILEQIETDEPSAGRSA